MGSFQQTEMLVAQDLWWTKRASKSVKVAQAGLAHVIIAQLQVPQVAMMCQVVDCWFPSYAMSLEIKHCGSLLYPSVCVKAVTLGTDLKYKPNKPNQKFSAMFYD